jgi:hypothetical protein
VIYINKSVVIKNNIAKYLLNRSLVTQLLQLSVGPHTPPVNRKEKDS